MNDVPDTMTAAVVQEPGDISIEEVPVPEPGAGEVLIAVEASGVCHSDVFTVEGQSPGVAFPRIPGHEVVGTVVATGDGVTTAAEGDRVGVGWHGGYCGACDSCRRGDLNMCDDGEATGVGRDGGHAEYMAAQEEACAAVPDALEATDAAPMLCAGVTTFNALRHTDATMGDTVAVIGVGGLGHLAVQYADAAGFETIAVDRSPDTAYLEELGADHVVDAEGEDVAARLDAFGGADVALVTAPAADAIEGAVQGLAEDGEVTVVGIPGEAVELDVLDLIDTRGAVSGWASGHAKDSEDTLDFAALKDVHSDVEEYALHDYEEAYRTMMAGEVRSRAVIVP